MSASPERRGRGVNTGVPELAAGAETQAIKEQMAFPEGPSDRLIRPAPKR